MVIEWLTPILEWFGLINLGFASGTIILLLAIILLVLFLRG